MGRGWPGGGLSHKLVNLLGLCPPLLAGSINNNGHEFPREKANHALAKSKGCSKGVWGWLSCSQRWTWLSAEIFPDISMCNYRV